MGKPDYDNKFAPESIEITSTVGAVHSVTAFYRWDSPTFTNTDVLFITLILNDSPDSKYGPGVFLDKAQEGFNDYPVYTPIINTFSDMDTYKEPRSGDEPVWVRFGIIIVKPYMITPGITYQITWQTPIPNPNPAKDNADLNIITGDRYFSGCTLIPICTTQKIRCHVNKEDWGLELPGKSIFHKPPEDQCEDLDLWHLFLAWIKGQ